MTEKELQSVREYFKTMNECIEHLTASKMSLLPGAIRYDKDKVQTSPQDTIADIMAELVDRERELFKDMPIMINKRNHIKRVISQMTEYKDIIQMYYIDIRSWGYIANELGTTKSKVYYTLRPKALKEFKRIDNIDQNI